jgi:DNA-binding transcriptional MerR regulator
VRVRWRRRAQRLGPYSADDAARPQRISELVDAGINLAGIARILDLEDDTEHQCNVAALPPNLESAYHEFMAG